MSLRERHVARLSEWHNYAEFSFCGTTLRNKLLAKRALFSRQFARAATAFVYFFCCRGLDWPTTGGKKTSVSIVCSFSILLQEKNLETILCFTEDSNFLT